MAQWSKNGLYIDGQWTPTAASDPIINPATEEVIGHAPTGGNAETDMAIAAARRTFDESDWRFLPSTTRQRILTRFLDILEERRTEIVELIVAEAGATQALANTLQFATPIAHARHTVEICTRPAITALTPEINQTMFGDRWLASGVAVREPVGVVSAITAYNFPFFLNLAKVVPALAAGCTVVLKPSPYTPFQALILGDVANESGLPAGVLNIINGGVDTGELMTTDPRVDLVSFTGSDLVGAKIQAQAAPTLKRCLLELGGKSAFVVRHDADLQRAAVTAAMHFTIHAGQGCALMTRTLVHNSVRADFTQMVKSIVEQAVIGNPADPKVTLGPLIREAQRQRTENYVAIALDEGANLVTGGRRPDDQDKGFFYKPTLFDNVSNSSRIAQEEVFGPIGVVIGFDDDDEAVAMANQSEFGLSGGIFSADVATAYEMAMRIRTGELNINGGPGKMSSHFPFGGIKRSGYGREYGEEGLNEFTYIKTIGYHAG
ncbi:MAG: aldehyde dehydrogenase family protein [Pseudomonadota bacterium]